ncbi:MAG: enoyl-CoA hydratase/isomerase family protein [Alphaproteobacteria bacterium]|nr:enoyl-CoA hydratase/isomerase family protein [Alphaproteobacteria bacterium]
MPSGHILEIAGAHASLTLNRPERHNALDLDDLADLARSLAELATRPDIRVLVLTGAGQRSFCSGVNLGQVAEADWRDNPLERLTDLIEKLPFATLCALNGGVYGGGSDLALACDFRVGIAGMRCFVPPARLGIHYHVGGLRRAVAKLGLGSAKRMFLAAETFDDRELLRLQFLDRLLPAAEFEAGIAAFAADLAGMAPLAYAGMKRTLTGLALGGLDEAAARRDAQACWASEDFREGQRALAEKRAPVFQGR